ncbi:hypothetical protein GCM10023100_00080 [Actinocorallia cavernae]|uniref:Twin-arginine translocation signal domain-containing protein n=1 Tax=Actinocorallia cavernae TaxID=328075 RepID=A0ABP8S5D0_9ACTN
MAVTRTRRLSKTAGAVGAALALAAHYFPCEGEAQDTVAASFRDAAFLLSGQLDKWARWRDLPHDEKQRIGAVVALAPQELASVTVFAARARELLDFTDGEPPALPFRPAVPCTGRGEAAVALVGGGLLEYVDRILQRLRRDHPRRRPDEPAGPGIWLPRTQYAAGSGLIQGRTVVPSSRTAAKRMGPTGRTCPRCARCPTRRRLRCRPGNCSSWHA